MWDPLLYGIFFKAFDLEPMHLKFPNQKVWHVIINESFADEHTDISRANLRNLKGSRMPDKPGPSLHWAEFGLHFCPLLNGLDYLFYMLTGPAQPTFDTRGPSYFIIGLSNLDPINKWVRVG